MHVCYIITCATVQVFFCALGFRLVSCSNSINFTVKISLPQKDKKKNLTVRTTLQNMQTPHFKLS